MHAKYHPIKCNIAGCEALGRSLSLCDRHQEQYLSTDRARRLQEDVVALRDGTSSAPLRIRAFLWSVLHYVTNAKVPYMEHFPLESIYLLHRRNLLARLSKPGSDIHHENCKELNRLINDFDHPGNETLEDLRLRRAWHFSDPRDAYNRSLDFSGQLRMLVIFGPKAYMHLASIVFAAFMGIVLCEERLGLHIQFPVVLSMPRLAVAYFMCLGLVVGGLVFLNRITPVLTKAQFHHLYADAADNRCATKIALRILGRFQTHSGLDFATAGIVLASLVGLLTPWPLDPQLSLLESMATATMAVFALLVLYPLGTMYSIYANASVSMEGLPPSRFRVDLHTGDGRLGIGDLVDLLVAGIIFNASALVLLWVLAPIAFGLLLPGVEWWKFAAYQLVIFPISLLRVAQLRRLLKVRRSVAMSVQQAVDDEILELKKLPVAERNARQHNIDRIQRLPILTNAVRGRIKEIVIVVLIPLVILFIDKAYTAWTAATAASH